MTTIYTKLCMVIMVFILAGHLSIADEVKAQSPGENEYERIDTLRVISWNIQSRNLALPEALDSIAAIINDRNAHWVALRQVDSMTTRIGAIDVMQQIADRTGLDPIFHTHFPHQGGGFGNGILTGLPIIDGTYEAYIYNHPEDFTVRGMQQMVVDLNGIPVVVMNTWLGHESETNRIANVAELLERMQTYMDFGAPFILAGSLNEEPDGPASQNLLNVFNDVWTEVGDGTEGWTHTGDRRADAMYYYNVGGSLYSARPLSMEIITTNIGTPWKAMFTEYEVTELSVGTSTERDQEVPEMYVLGQNYPNPFNPVTTIRYTVPAAGNVSLEVYTITGQHVATLVNGLQSAGIHSVRFDASNLSSGIYIYTMRASDFSQSKRLTLIK